MTPRAVDFCSGRGGITAGMLAAGFRVLGVDIVQHKGYPAPVLLQDIRHLDADLLPEAAWDHAGVPCPRFSKARPSRVRDPPTDKDCDILRAFLNLRDDRGTRFWSVENVSGAVPFFEAYIGKPRFINGPFYLWGNFPTFLAESTGLSKGMSNWGLDTTTGERTWGVKKAADGVVSGDDAFTVPFTDQLRTVAPPRRHRLYCSVTRFCRWTSSTLLPAAMFCGR